MGGAPKRRRGGPQFGGFDPSYFSSASSDEETPFGFTSAQQHSPAPEPAVHHLPVSLDELAAGFTRKLKITKRIQDASGAIVSVSSVVTVEGRAGWRSGTRITFNGAGDEMHGRPAQDVVFVVQELPHPVFQRRADDLHCSINVPLVDVLSGETIMVAGLNGVHIPVPLMNAAPDSVITVPNAGMPGKSGTGSLKVSIKIDFPANLTELQRAQLKAVLA